MERDKAYDWDGEIVADFNSHAHVERDSQHKGIGYLRDISTHTLTWSVTRGDNRELLPLQHFNSHAHVERDSCVPAACQDLSDFNSHAHVERDVLTLSPAPPPQDFNSHAHVERDDGQRPCLQHF